MQGIERTNVPGPYLCDLAMAKLPSLGNLHRSFPNWWHQAEPAAVAPENFQPKPEPTSEQQDESRFEKLAEIALHESRVHANASKKAA